MSDQLIDSQEILNRVRHNIIEKNATGKYDKAELERILEIELTKPGVSNSTSSDFNNMEKHMLELIRLSDPWISEPVPRHREGIVGYIIQKLKRIYLRLLSPFHNELLRRQKIFNAAVTLTFQDILDKQKVIFVLEKRITEIQNRLDELRMEKGLVLKQQEKLQKQVEEILKTLDVVNNLLSAKEKLKDLFIKAGLWFNEPVVVDIDPKGLPFISRVTERIVEKSFVVRNIPNPPLRILDLGCCESLLSIELASNGYSVVGLDFRPYSLRHPQFIFLRGDLCNIPLKSNSVDVVCLLSTVEHVGIGHYGDVRMNEMSDRKVIEEVIRVIRPKGRVILTVPYGKPRVNEIQRIYGREDIIKLLEGLKIIIKKFAINEIGGWVLTEDEAYAQSLDSLKEVQAVALIVAEKK